MVSPEEAERLARRIVELYRDAEADLIRLLARRLSRGLANDQWAADRLAELTQLRKQVQAEVRRLQRAVPAEASSLITEAWEAGAKQADSDLASFVPSSEEWTAPFSVRPSEAAMAALNQDLLRTLDSTTLRILRTAEGDYRSVIAEVTSRGLAGEFTRRQAAQAALDKFAMRGVVGFEDRLGRQWSLASYTEMACRSAASRASLAAKMQRYVDRGKDLVIVTDAPGECGRCRPWEGKVLSLSGADPEHSSLDAATGAGLFHANCRHDFGLYVPGLTRERTGLADPEGEAARVQQRYLERGIRSWKMREAAAMDDQATQYAKAKQREWQARLRQHIDETGGKRLRYREQIKRAI